MDRMKGITLLTLLLLVVGCAATGPSVRQPESVLDTPEGHYRQGMQKLELGNTKGALADFQRAQKLDPEYAGTYVGFALIEATAGKFQEALRYLETARKKDKKWIDVYLAQGRIQVMQAKQDWLKDALETYAEARKLGNRDDRVAFYEGEAYRKAGQYQNAENAYSRAIDLKGPIQARAAQALSEVQMTRRAAPGTQVGLRVAELDPLTRANLCALLIDELKVDELVEKQRPKMYDTGFQSPGGQRQGASAKGPGDIEGHWAKAWIEQTLALDLPGLGLRSDGLFGPDEAVKRKDLAQVLQGLLVLITKDESLVTKYVGSESRFPDVRSDIYYYNAAALAVDRGLMRVGTLEGTFRPEETVSGAEAVLAIKDLKEALMTR